MKGTPDDFESSSGGETAGGRTRSLALAAEGVKVKGIASGNIDCLVWAVTGILADLAAELNRMVSVEQKAFGGGGVLLQSFCSRSQLLVHSPLNKIPLE